MSRPRMHPPWSRSAGSTVLRSNQLDGAEAGKVSEARQGSRGVAVKFGLVDVVLNRDVPEHGQGVGPELYPSGSWVVSGEGALEAGMDRQCDGP